MCVDSNDESRGCRPIPGLFGTDGWDFHCSNGNRQPGTLCQCGTSEPCANCRSGYACAGPLLDRSQNLRTCIPYQAPDRPPYDPPPGAIGGPGDSNPRPPTNYAAIILGGVFIAGALAVALST